MILGLKGLSNDLLSELKVEKVTFSVQNCKIRSRSTDLTKSKHVQIVLIILAHFF